MITIPRPLLTLLAAGFSLYVGFLGAVTITTNHHPVQFAACLVVWTALTVLSLAVRVVPTWVAVLNVVMTPVIAFGTALTLDPAADNGHATWYVAGLGVLLTITAVRRRLALAWLGVALLAAQVLVWAGPASFFALGAFGDVVWVGLAHLFSTAIRQASREVQQFALAERQAVEWQAAQDAHHSERQVRVAQTSRMASGMLERIAELEGRLDSADRQECRVLEQSIRDEIRGRRLLNDRVRSQVLAARRRGAMVQVLDDGGVDDLSPESLDPVLDQVASALAGVESERIIIRTAPRESPNAVTVVGISSGQSAAAALGLDDDDENVDLWLELPRPEARV